MKREDMKTEFSEDVRSLMEVPPYLPSVSLIIPFEPKMLPKYQLQQALKQAYNEVEEKLYENFSHELADPVLKRLAGLIQHVDYTSYRKSVCIFVSPVAEKIIYLSVEVDRKIVVGEFFQIRDVVKNRKEGIRLLLLVLSSNESKVYLVEPEGLPRLVRSLPFAAADMENDVAERVSNFSDPADRKEASLHKLLRKIDNSLSLLLQEYQLPLLVAAPERLAGHFKAHSHHRNQIAGYIAGNYIERQAADLKTLVEPFLHDWKALQEKNICSRLEHASNAGKLVSGIQQVYTASRCKNCALLVIEDGFTYAADKVDEDKITLHDSTHPIYISDAVDIIIENVLNAGGDVEFVSNGLLNAYDRIALIKYYSVH